MAADKGMTMQEDGKNYGDFLLDTVEAAKEQFTDREYEWLKESATEISNIENKLTELEEKYPCLLYTSYSRMKMKVPRMLPCEHRPIAIPAPMTRRQLKKMESNIPAVGPIRDRKSTRLNSSHSDRSRMPSSA